MERGLWGDKVTTNKASQTSAVAAMQSESFMRQVVMSYKMRANLHWPILICLFLWLYD